MTLTALGGPGLTDTDDVARLIPGDPDALLADARAIDGVVATLTTVADWISRADLGGWTGTAADAYTESAEPLRRTVLVAATALAGAAPALRAHADTLEWAQAQARAAVRQFENAAACMEPGPLGAPSIPAAQVRAGDALAEARAEVFASGNRAAAAIEAATLDAPINPGLWNQVGYQWSQLWQGGAEAFGWLAQLAWDTSNVRFFVDRDGWLTSNEQRVTGLVASAQDPLQLGKDVIDYDTWTTNPARAVGHLIPDAIATVLTGGSGLLGTRTAGAGARAVVASERVAGEAAEAAARLAAEAVVATAPRRAAVMGAAAKASAPVAKFSAYLFREGAIHGKDAIFRSYGYGAGDSVTLAREFERQARAKYARGDYRIGRADDFGQRVTISVELEGQGAAVGRATRIDTGWMIREDGSISLNTPFAGFSK